MKKIILILSLFVALSIQAQTFKSSTSEEDTIKLTGLTIPVSHSWKKSIGSSAYGYETSLIRFTDGMEWDNTYNPDKNGWSWYYTLPLAYGNRFNFEMSAITRIPTYKVKKKDVAYTSLEQLKGAYNESIWKYDVSAIGEPEVTILDTTLANGKPAIITHVSYFAKGFDNDFKPRYEVREYYMLLYYSETLKKATIFRMKFDIFEFKNKTIPDEATAGIFLNTLRKSDSQATSYFKSFVSDLQFN